MDVLGAIHVPGFEVEDDRALGVGGVGGVGEFFRRGRVVFDDLGGSP